MAMSVGNAKDGTPWMAKRIYDALVADSDAGLSDPLTAAQALGLAALCNAIAQGVVDEIQANARTAIGAEHID